MLAHYLEEAGVPTTQISLVRPHTEKTNPPRALWVPFELGSPFGVPNNPAFQRRVLLAVLKLLEAPQGPLLVDFPEEAPASSAEPTVLACPYIPPGQQRSSSEIDNLCYDFRAEVTSLRPWYDTGFRARGRTTVGVSRLSPEELADFFCHLLTEGKPVASLQNVSPAYQLRYAADDLKAYYNEAITAQPGMADASSEALARWFWQETVAGKMLKAVRASCVNSEDSAVKLVARMMIVPQAFMPKPPDKTGV